MGELTTLHVAEARRAHAPLDLVSLGVLEAFLFMRFECHWLHLRNGHNDPVPFQIDSGTTSASLTSGET
jgi:hypothetical protein